MTSLWPNSCLKFVISRSRVLGRLTSLNCIAWFIFWPYIMWILFSSNLTTKIYWLTLDTLSALINLFLNLALSQISISSVIIWGSRSAEFNIFSTHIFFWRLIASRIEKVGPVSVCLSFVYRLWYQVPGKWRINTLVFLTLYVPNAWILPAYFLIS